MQLCIVPFFLVALSLLVDGSVSFVCPSKKGRAHSSQHQAPGLAKKISWTDHHPKDRDGQTRLNIHDYGHGNTDGITTSLKNDNLQGIVYMALSALSFSLMFLGVKIYSNAPTFTLIFYRSVVQAALSLLVILKGTPGKKNNTIAPPEATYTLECRKLLILRGSFGSAAVGAFFYAIQKLPLPDAITLQFTTPVFAALLAVPLLGEPWNRSDQIGAVVCLAGVLLMARPSWLFGVTSETAATTASSIVPTAVGLMGAALAALAYILVRKIGTRADANTMVLYYAVISGLTAPLGAKLLSGSSTGRSSWNVLGNPTPTDLLVFVGLGVFGFLGQLWTNKGLTKCESAATATLVTNTQIVFAFLFEVTVLHESLSTWSLTGTALIVGYMVFAGISKLSNEKRE